MARLHIIILFGVGLILASCDVVLNPTPAPSIEMKKLRDGRVCAKAEHSGWYCVKE